MTNRLRLRRVNAIKLKTSSHIPARIVGSTGIDVDRENGVYTLSVNDQFVETATDDARIYAESAAADAATAATDAATATAQAAIAVAAAATFSPITATFETKADAEAASVDDLVQQITLMGHTSIGVGAWPAAVRVNTEPSHEGKFRTVDRYLPDGSTSAGNGGWWELKANEVNPLMFGAAGDGSTDDTTAVQNALDFGAANVFFAPCTGYSIGVVTPSSNQRLYGPGLIIQDATGANVIDINNQDNVIVDGLRIQGVVAVADDYDSAASSNTLVYIRGGSTNITVRNCYLTRSQYFGILVESGSQIHCVNNEIVECCFGIRFTGVTRGSMTGNIFRDCVMYTLTPTVTQFCVGLVLDSTEGHAYGLCSQITIANNVIKKIGYGQAILVHGGTNWTITGNSIEDATMAISVNPFNATDTLSYGTITGNTCRGLTGATLPDDSDVGITVQAGGVTPDITDVTVTGNTIQAFNRNALQANSGGILVGYTKNVSVTGNTITACGCNGIVLTDVEEGVVVSGNNINTTVANGSDVQNGIRVRSTARGVIVGNLLYGMSNATAGTGIYFDAASNVRVAENRFYDCTFRTQNEQHAVLETLSISGTENSLDLGGLDIIELAHGSPTNVTSFTGVVPGKLYKFRAANGNTTFTSACLESDGGGNINLTAKDVMLAIGGASQVLSMAAKMPDNS
jgi:parallel beta-helix repeat protein